MEAYRFLGEGKNAASLKQIRAALSFAYKHWDLKNPFAKIEPPLQKEPQIRYLLLADIRRLLGYLKVRQQGYGSVRFPRFCGLGCDKGKDSHEKQQERSALRPGV